MVVLHAHFGFTLSDKNTEVVTPTPHSKTMWGPAQPSTAQCSPPPPVQVKVYHHVYVAANVQIQLMYTLADIFQLMYTLAENQLMYYRLAS